MNSSQIHVVEVGKKKELQLQIDVPTKKGTERRNIPGSQASPEIKAYLKNPSRAKESAINVDFEMEGGLVKRVRLTGQPWVEPPVAPTIRPNPGNAPQPGVAMFENPYNFIPALPRNTEHKTLGDAEPAGHHRYHADKWSGRISVELTTVTPLLIPEFISEDEHRHKTFCIRKDESGAPYLPPTSIKGALRAAYEAVTNSRMGVLEKHDERLPFRMEARDSLQLVPCRIVSLRTDELDAQLLPGLSPFAKDGKPSGNGADCLMYAAWLHRYRKYNSNSLIAQDKHESCTATPYPALRGSPVSLPQHGDHVFVKVTKPNSHYSKRFSYLQVEKIGLATGTMPSGWHEGWVYISGPNIMNKHEEKVFIEKAGAPTLPLSPEILGTWEKLITNYQTIHKKELQQRYDANPTQSPSDYLGNEPGKTGFSRHVFHPGAEKLKVDDLCYAKVKTDPYNNPNEVVALYPVAISRDLYSESPADLISPSFLEPAKTLEELSPSDRIFGWVGKKGQFKGQLRIGAVTCVQGAAAIEPLGNEGIPLAILGAPKPAQARFYAAKNPQGEPLANRSEKAKAYAAGQGLRGRKVYPHQKQATKSEYWEATTNSAQAITEEVEGKTVYREWQPPDNIRTEQNRSITEWVKPKMTFTFDIDVTNLSRVELGALLWLLNQPAERYFRFGGGKPLGFGSATLKISSLNLRDGEAIRMDYAAFGESDDALLKKIKSIEAAQPLIDAYKQALPSAVGEATQSFDNLSIIKAFVNAAKDGKLPVHYPRKNQPPNPEEKIFEWFVSNEGKNGPKKCLPDLEKADRGLPYFP